MIDLNKDTTKFYRDALEAFSANSFDAKEDAITLLRLELICKDIEIDVTADDWINTPIHIREAIGHALDLYYPGKTQKPFLMAYETGAL